MFIVHVLYNGGPESWAAALIDYDGEPRIGLRWNGEAGQGIGNPQSRGRPIWFVVPEELENVRETAEQLSHSQEGGLLAGYREMANDGEREAEAREWSEGLIADASNQKG